MSGEAIISYCSCAAGEACARCCSQKYTPHLAECYQQPDYACDPRCPAAAAAEARALAATQCERIAGTNSFTLTFGAGETKPSNPKEAIGSGKLPLELVPDVLAAEAATAFMEGALKYGRFNWRIAGVRASTYYAAEQRHMKKWWNGEDRDVETRVKHLANAAACIGILLDAELCGMLNDDRPPRAELSKRIDELKDVVAHLKGLFKDHNPKQYTIDDTKE